MIYRIILLLLLLLPLSDSQAASDRVLNATAVKNGSGMLFIPATTPTASRVCQFSASNTLEASAVTLTELGFLTGVTSSVQTQLDGKASTGNYITALTGDVSATGPGSVAATVNAVGGVTATNVASGANLANAATNAATANTIVKRDASGNFAAGTINASILGTASNITGLLGFANGGTACGNQQCGLNSLTNTGAATAGDILQYIGGNAQFAPYTAPGTTGTANTLSYYDGSGDLVTLPDWSVNPDHFGLTNALSYGSVDGENINFMDHTLDIGMTVDSPTSNVTGYAETMNHDNAASTDDFGNIYLRRMELRLNGNGHVNYSAALDTRHLLGNGSTTGELQDGNGFNSYVNVGTGFSVLGTYNFHNVTGTIDGTINTLFLQNLYVNGAGSATDANGLNIGFQLPVDNNLNLVNINNNQSVGGYYNGIFLNSSSAVALNSSMFGVNNSGATTGSLTIFSAFNQNTATVGGDFRAAQWGNDAAVTGNAAGLLTNQGGVVSGSYTGVGAYLNDDAGTTGNGNNIIYFDGGSQGASGKEIHGNLFGLSLTNSHDVPDTNTNIQPIYVNNSGAGYRFNGLGIYNQSSADMDEEIRGISMDLQGDARTGTGLNLSMQGAYIDDVHGLQVSMNNVTSSSTTNHVMMAEISGGNLGIYGVLKPFDNATVDTGNYYSSTTEIANGSPVTGTDILQQIFQSNLILHDTIGAGPIGLGVNGMGIVHQVGFDSGVTLPYYRSLLLGTSVPTGSGGTITDAVVLELLGFSSFGGSITTTNRVGIQDAQLVTQDFCDGSVTDCWFLRVRDTNADNALPKLAINTSNYKVSSNVRLEINDGHIKTTQTTAPVATVDANAGTGATCSVGGSDTDVSGTVTIVIGTAPSSGAQCSIAFDSAYNSTPKCSLTPTSNDAGANLVGYWASKTTTDLVVNFSTAAISGTYSYDYRCDE